MIFCPVCNLSDIRPNCPLTGQTRQRASPATNSASFAHEGWGGTSSRRCCLSRGVSTDGAARGPRLPRARRGSSLASTDQMVTGKPLSRCPYGTGRAILELFSGQVYPDRCRSSSCAFCLPLNARRRTLAITLSRPERMIRLSLVADADDSSPCSTALVRIKRIRQHLKRKGVDPGEWCFTIERNPKGTGYHVHCLQRGPYLSQAALQEACAAAHAGFPDIRKIHREGRWVNQYGLKGFGADGYGLKTFRPNSDPKEALRINNGRVEHHSRGFFHIGNVSARVRLCERAAIRELNSGKSVAFMSVHPDQVDRILGSDRLRFTLIRDIERRSRDKRNSSPLLCRLKRTQDA